MHICPFSFGTPQHSSSYGSFQPWDTLSLVLGHHHIRVVNTVAYSSCRAVSTSNRRWDTTTLSVCVVLGHWDTTTLWGCGSVNWTWPSTNVVMITWAHIPHLWCVLPYYVYSCRYLIRVFARYLLCGTICMHSWLWYLVIWTAFQYRLTGFKVDEVSCNFMGDESAFATR